MCAMHAAPTVRMYIETFGREVLIDEHHPLTVAQRARNAAKDAGVTIAEASSERTADPLNGNAIALLREADAASAATVIPISTGEARPAHGSRARRRGGR